MISEIQIKTPPKYFGILPARKQLNFSLVSDSLGESDLTTCVKKNLNGNQIVELFPTGKAHFTESIIVRVETGDNKKTHTEPFIVKCNVLKVIYCKIVIPLHRNTNTHTHMKT